jgi:hypothetical protein
MSKNKLLLLLTASLFGCGVPEAGQNCESGRCDDPPDSEVEDTPCDGVMVDHSGKGFKKVAGRLGDPVAQAVFRAGDTCPTTYADIMQKMRENDKEGCEGERDGITTRLVSETAQAAGSPTNYRGVASRTCGDRDTHEVLFSLFGIRAGATTLPDNVEIIAFDKTAGVFNFYETSGDKINFFGNSKDMLLGADGEDRRCANCHPAGGLVMKELDTPWLHWEGHMDTPGARELVEAHKDLGTKNSGAEFEGVVKRGNTEWNKTRLATLKEGDKVKTSELLKPLFCSIEVNLDNGADFESPVGGGAGGSTIRAIPFDSMLDPQLKGFGSISITFEDYDAIIKENGQRVQGVTGAIDTVFDYVFLERSHVDNDYINQLKAAGIIDDDFIKDVLMVDFTRHVFSDDRCGLATLLPEVDAADLTPDKLRAAVSAAISAESPAEGSPAAVLLANFENTEDTAAHAAKVEAFTNACKALGSRPFLENALAITSLNREKGRQMPVFEFEATMPTDNQNTNENARLHPTTCQLTNSFVP